ncbi:hypothetical protein EIP91_002525 [Steccherinum ochraceum]|uniref:DUF6533 domain-containing protein n=1 Tax=Steccherinum ochraceum TaxID=92696 RepID=A0A4V2MWA1_9APHY|nr:hypothetical protein EIP91_002525 [Steccherinum ochraceum]
MFRVGGQWDFKYPTSSVGAAMVTLRTLCPGAICQAALLAELLKYVSESSYEGFLACLVDSILTASSAVFLWEWLTSLDFEWSFLTKQRAHTRATILYFLGRYIAFVSVCMQLVRLGLQKYVRFLYGFSQAPENTELSLSQNPFYIYDIDDRQGAMCSFLGVSVLFAFGANALSSAILAERA